MKINYKELQQKPNSNIMNGKMNELGNNIPILASSNIHRTIWNKFSELNLDKKSNILILGSGAGAFDQKLYDEGYVNITSIEFVQESFLAKGPKLLVKDLNNDFDDLGQFDVIFAIEVIEHLENQFHFIRNIKKILNIDGVLFLSTPNVENTFVRLEFLFLGRFIFNKRDLYGTGHINPIFKHIFLFNLEQNELFCEDYFSNGNIFFTKLKNKNLLKKILFFFIWLFSFLFYRRDTKEISIFKIKKTKI